MASTKASASRQIQQSPILTAVFDTESERKSKVEHSVNNGNKATILVERNVAVHANLEMDPRREIYVPRTSITLDRDGPFAFNFADIFVTFLHGVPRVGNSGANEPERVRHRIENYYIFSTNISDFWFSFVYNTTKMYMAMYPANSKSSIRQQLSSLYNVMLKSGYIGESVPTPYKAFLEEMLNRFK